MYLIFFSLNTFLQIHAHDLGSVFADLYTSLYIAFDNVLSEEFMCFTCSKDSCANTSFIRSYNSDPRQLSNIPGSLLLLRPKLRSGDDDFINPAEHAANCRPLLPLFVSKLGTYRNNLVKTSQLHIPA